MPVWGVVLIVSGATLAAAAAVWCAVYLYARRLFFRLFGRREQPAPVTERQKREAELNAAALIRLAEKPQESVTLTGERGAELFGQYIDNGADKTAVLVHGYAGDHTTRAHNALSYLALGYNVLLPDNAGHGRSGGQFVTMGYADAVNVLYWVDWLTRAKGPSAVVLDGVSMGGATVLNVSHYERRPVVKAIVADCAFTSPEAEIRSQFARRHVCAFPAVRMLCRMAEKRGFDLRKNAPLAAVRKSVTPTLFIHGERDKFVPFAMGRTLYEQNASEKRLFTVPDAAHAASFIVDPDGYETAIKTFLEETVC